MSFQARKYYRSPIRSLDEYIAREYADAVCIDVNLYAGFDLFEGLSMGRQRELNRDLYDFIDAKLYPIPLKYPVTLRFHGGGLTDEEREWVRSALQEHYALILLDKALDLKINLAKLLSLSLLGVFLLGAWFASQLSSIQPLFTEILSIAGTFSLWEAVDLWLLERASLKRERRNAGQAVNSQVVFVP